MSKCFLPTLHSSAGTRFKTPICSFSSAETEAQRAKAKLISFILNGHTKAQLVRKYISVLQYKNNQLKKLARRENRVKTNYKRTKELFRLHRFFQ